MELDNRLTSGLGKLGIKELTQIQKQTLEPAYEGKNLIGCSGTGTGKTFAYLLPVIMKNAEDKGLYSVIIAPSKELCIQICSQINQLSNHSGIMVRSVAVFGGVSRQRQLDSLKDKPNIIVGTHQRIQELIKEKKIPAHLVKTFIIDEADKLVNKDNIDGVMELRKCFMRDIQIMLFSASITPATRKFALQLGSDFLDISTNEKMLIPKNIEHIYFVAEKRELVETVRKVIKALNAKHCMIFSNSQYDTDETAQKLQFHHYNVGYIHAKCDKNKRRQIVDGFQAKKVDFLICSDIAARGLHFDHVNVVINVGLPEQPIDYLHRAGRCGRDGAKAICASIITEGELSKIKACQKAFAINMLPKDLYQGKVVKK